MIEELLEIIEGESERDARTVVKAGPNGKEIFGGPRDCSQRSGSCFKCIYWFRFGRQFHPKCVWKQGQGCIKAEDDHDGTATFALEYCPGAEVQGHYKDGARSVLEERFDSAFDNVREERRGYVNPCKAKCDNEGMSGNACCERKCSASAPGYDGVEKPWRDWVHQNCAARMVPEARNVLELEEQREARSGYG